MPPPLLLLTGADGPEAKWIIAALGQSWSIRAVSDTSPRPIPGTYETRHGDLRDPGFAASVLDDVAVLVHAAGLAPVGPDSEALDRAARGTYVLFMEALRRPLRAAVVVSSLSLFDAYPAAWDVTPVWRPRPQPVLDQLTTWLGELSARELTRVAPWPVVAWRLDADTSAETLRAAMIETLAGAPPGWSVTHLGPAGSRKRRALEAPQAAPQSAPKKVVVFGAGSAMGASFAHEYHDRYQLRQTDVRPLADIIAAGPRTNQVPGSPLPVLLPAPHESRVVDIGDYGQVRAACEGMDAIVNVSVVRVDPVQTFRVNTLGAYHLARAAAELGIKRIVQTGPQLQTTSAEMGYHWDHDIGEDAPPRPGRWIYTHSKYLGQELMRIYAEHFGLSVPVLLFDGLEVLTAKRRAEPMAVTWRDSSSAIQAALDAPSLPSPFELFTISADLPHGKHRALKARLVLGWSARDNLRELWGDGHGSQT